MGCLAGGVRVWSYGFEGRRCLLHQPRVGFSNSSPLHGDTPIIASLFFRNDQTTLSYNRCQFWRLEDLVKG